LVAERKQVLKVAAAARDDDDVDLRVRVKRLDGAHHLARGPVALHARVADAELDRGPAELRVAEHILLGIRALAGQEADAAGEAWQPLLALGCEEPLIRELPTQPLELLEEIAEADVAQVVPLHRERAALRPPVGLHGRDDAVGLLELLLE